VGRRRRTPRLLDDDRVGLTGDLSEEREAYDFEPLAKSAAKTEKKTTVKAQKPVKKKPRKS